MRWHKDPLEQIAQQGVRRQQQPEDDRVSYIVEAPDGELKTVYDIERDIVFTDPDGDGFPMVVSRRIYKLDDTGRPFGNVRDVGKCREEGCWVRESRLYTCRHCHLMVCQKHALLVGTRVYCRRRPCSIFARLRQAQRIFIFIFRICFGPMIVNRKVAEKKRDIVSEKDFFAAPEEKENLSVLERGSDESDY